MDIEKLENIDYIRYYMPGWKLNKDDWAIKITDPEEMKESFIDYLEVKIKDMPPEDRLEKYRYTQEALVRECAKGMVDENFKNNTIEWIDRTIKRLKSKNESNDNGKDIPDYINKAIHQVALEIDKSPSDNNYKKVSSALKLYHSTGLNGEEVAKKMNIAKSTFSTWKTKVEAKL